MIKRLVVAPHCDDETLGCGGLLAKYPTDTAVVVLTEPDEIRVKEFKRAKEQLGYEHACFLDLTDGDLHSDMRGLVTALDEVVGTLKPQEMYVPFPSMHQDHIAAYEGGMRAARLSMSDGHHYTPSVFVYDVAAYDINLYPTELQWNVFESLTEDEIDRKVAALDCYESQTVIGPHPAKTLKQQAQVIGNARQIGYAEQYALIRAVRA